MNSLSVSGGAFYSKDVQFKVKLQPWLVQLQKFVNQFRKFHPTLTPLKSFYNQETVSTIRFILKLLRSFELPRFLLFSFWF